MSLVTLNLNNVEPPLATESVDRSSVLSGIEINQNQIPTLDTDYIVSNGINDYFQAFYLPSNYARAGGIYPDLTGFQLCISSTAGFASGSVHLFHPFISWTLDINHLGTWTSVISGQTTPVDVDGTQVWIDVYFDENVIVTEQFASNLYRIGFATQNIDLVWYSQPGPLAAPQGGFDSLGNPLPNNGSFMFRLLTASADSGTDFLGNSYRSSVYRNYASNIQTTNSSNSLGYWMSKPNPSKFAVETLYLDVRDSSGNAQVIDRILINPMTPGPTMHIYTSQDDSTGGQSLTTYVNRMWTPVPGSYALSRRTEYAMPFPIVAKYLALEFSSLQATTYDPGLFAQPTTYSKYPKWVFDYFFGSQTSTSPSPYIADTVNVVYNLLEFAYDYYLEDLQQGPLTPSQIQPTSTQASTNTADLTTLNQIYTNMAPYQFPPGERAINQTTMLGKQALALASPNAPIEIPVTSLPVNQEVSSSNRDALLQEASWPDMSFPIPCRHFYKSVTANFEYNRAYFVGIRELALIRDNYVTPFDQGLYVEVGGDTVNSRRSDFASFNNLWVVGQNATGGQT